MAAATSTDRLATRPSANLRAIDVPALSNKPRFSVQTLRRPQPRRAPRAGLLQHQPTTAQINPGLSLSLDEKRGSRHRSSGVSRLFAMR